MNELRGLWRGKRVDNGKWVTGDLSRIKAADHYFVDEIMVEETTLGECTGLRDKNGTAIFEGDIITDKRGALFRVKWNEKWSHFACETITNAKFTPCMNVGTMKHYEVIGNIHDNPELLQKGAGE